MPRNPEPSVKRMKLLFKLRPLCSSSDNILLSFHVAKFQRLCLSSLSKASELHNSSKNEKMKNQKEANEFSALFHEITEILGTESINVVNDPSGFLVSDTGITQNKSITESSECTSDVCKNAKSNGFEKEKEKLTELIDTQFENMGETDVSPIVHKVAEIVRGENYPNSMEERLDREGFELNSEVVDKVLKRCFKVPYLAFRFFNWVKLKNGSSHTTETYNTIMYIAGESREFGMLEELVAEMQSNPYEMNIKSWSILISHYGKAKMVGKTLTAFDKMKESGIEPDQVAYKLMLRALCNAGKADILLEFYKEMIRKDMDLDMNLYKLILKCLAQSEDTTAVDLVVDNMIKNSQIPEHDAYACALKTFCISGRINEALQLIRNLKNRDVSLDAEIVETLVRGLCRADKITDALEIVDIMKKKDDIDEKIYGIIVNGYLRRNDISKAFELFQSIKDSGYSPTIATYTNMMQHLVDLSEFQKAFELYNEMLEKGLKLDILAITSMVAGLVRQKRISEAWNLFKSMEEKGVRATPKCYTILINELCKVSMTDDIIKVLMEMKSSKVGIGSNIYQRIVSILERKGETKKVENVLQTQRASEFYKQKDEDFIKNLHSRKELSMDLNSCQIKQKKLDSQILESRPTAYCDNDLQEVCRVLSSSKDWLLKLEALEKCTIRFTPELVVEILRRCNLHSGAALHFFTWVEKQAGYNHTTETYNMAIKVSGHAKDFKHMRSLFYEMRRKGFAITQDTWTILILQYGRIGMTDIALRNFREMKASGCNPPSSTYKALIISLCGTKGRKVDEAIQIFKEMLKAGFIPDKEMIEIYLGCLCETDKLLEARKCAESLCKFGFTIPLAYSLYLRALSRAGRLEQALAIADEVGQEHPTLYQYTYGSLVHGLLRKGRLDDALAKIESMKQVGFHPTVHVYTSLIVYFFREKQVAKALEMFKQMKDEGCEPTIVTYSALIRGYMNMGQVDDAWNIFNDMKVKGPHPDFKTYSMFMTCLCQVGKSEEALQLLSEMVASGVIPSTVNFRTVTFGLNREGKHNLARTVSHMKSDVKRKRKFLT